MTTMMARSLQDMPRNGDSCRHAENRKACGGASILDLALCLILAVTVVGLLLIAL